MHQYDVSDVEKLLGLPRSTIRALVDAGFVKPARGPRNALLFSFQDLIVLRTARALSAANVPHRRITKSLKELRKHLPEEMPLQFHVDAIAAKNFDEMFDRALSRSAPSRSYRVMQRAFFTSGQANKTLCVRTQIFFADCRLSLGSAKFHLCEKTAEILVSRTL